MEAGQSYIFPPVEQADADGLLAIGGDLSPACLVAAYTQGIFPWYSEGEPICWWSPDPRCVLFPDKLRVSSSMQSLINSKRFAFTRDQAFREVVTACRDSKRKDQGGTWIQEEIIDAYTRLHEAGLAISGEAWLDGQLVGGLYGVRIGRVFFGESMFYRVSNASKFAFIQLVRSLQQESVALIDCQVRTGHLVSLGAEMIPRAAFISLLNKLC